MWWSSTRARCRRGARSRSSLVRRTARRVRTWPRGAVTTCWRRDTGRRGTRRSPGCGLTTEGVHRLDTAEAFDEVDDDERHRFASGAVRLLGMTAEPTRHHEQDRERRERHDSERHIEQQERDADAAHQQHRRDERDEAVCREGPRSLRRRTSGARSPAPTCTSRGTRSKAAGSGGTAAGECRARPVDPTLPSTSKKALNDIAATTVHASTAATTVSSGRVCCHCRRRAEAGFRCRCPAG